MQRAVSGQTIAQFLAPTTIQLFSTPLHLLGLDFYNRGGHLRWEDRWKIIRKNWAGSGVARMCRMVPAYGIGGIVNTKVRSGLMERLA